MKIFLGSEEKSEYLSGGITLQDDVEKHKVKKRILIGTSLFYPLQGGGEDVLLNWIKDFSAKGYEICVLTPSMSLLNEEKNFNFEILRLRNEKLSDLNQMEKDFDNLVVGYSLVETDYPRKLMNKALEILDGKKPFDYYIGYGDWGAYYGTHPYNQKPITSFASLVKKKYPHIITMRLMWDAQMPEWKSDTDLIINAAPYELIKNYNFQAGLEKRLVLIPKPENNAMQKFDYEEWLLRPYDFIFNNPHLNKGGMTVFNIAKKLRDKKFLVKEGHWGQDNYLDGKKILEKLRTLPNVTIIESLNNRESKNSMAEDFYRQGKYLLYPSILEGFGLMPLEAAMQGTIPLCSDTNILRYSSSPFSEFIYCALIGFYPLNLFMTHYPFYELDYTKISDSWVEQIVFLDNNPQRVQSIYRNLKYAEDFMKNRYEDSVKSFFTELKKIQ